MQDSTQHATEADKNLYLWDRKPLLQEIYADFHRQIAERVDTNIRGVCVELGSGIGNIRDHIPGCLRTDLFEKPWLDGVENAYQLSFEDRSVSHLILFDVFHHLQYPGTALEEFERVLAPSGRVIIFEPCVSLLGRLVYGPMHPEPLGLEQAITWRAPKEWRPVDPAYYAAQGNASRIFVRGEESQRMRAWTPLEIKRLSAISYVASGGYSGPQLYPQRLLPLMQYLDKALNFLPGLFATRLLVVLKRSDRN